MRVAELWRYPVKSMQGQRLDVAEVGPRGVDGDRGWAIYDAATGRRLTGRQFPALLQAHARLVGVGVRIELPDGVELHGDDHDVDERLSAWLDHRVTLRAAPDEEIGRAPTGLHDDVALTLVARSSLHGHDVRRFRPTVVLEPDPDRRTGDDGEPTATGRDDALLGTTVQLGAGVDAVTVDVELAVPRCVMVTLAQPGLPVNRDVLRWVHRERGGVLSVGGPVRRPGRLRVGDPVLPHLR